MTLGAIYVFFFFKFDPYIAIIGDIKNSKNIEERGKFKTVPEYPEFSWLEGIVNAVTHREYGMSGAYILVTMYDDRLEIKSPGKLPNIVTIDNIKETCYARNPRMSRVLTD